MDVGGAGAEGRGDCGEGQIVGGDEADGVALDEAADQGFGADAAVMGVGAAGRR